jgi:hypothetical protein
MELDQESDTQLTYEIYQTDSTEIFRGVVREGHYLFVTEIKSNDDWVLMDEQDWFEAVLADNLVPFTWVSVNPRYRTFGLNSLNFGTTIKMSTLQYKQTLHNCHIQYPYKRPSDAVERHHLVDSNHAQRIKK